MSMHKLPATGPSFLLHLAVIVGLFLAWPFLRLYFIVAGRDEDEEED